MEDRECKKKITLMMVAFIIVIAFIAGAAMISPAMALHISMADSTLIGNHSMIIMAANGTLLWEGYTTQVADLGAISDPGNTTFLLHFKAENKNIFESANTLLDEIVRNINTSMVAIIVLCLVAGVLIGRR